MKSTYLTNLVLILFVIGLYWYNNQNESHHNDVIKLASIASDDIQFITISRPKTDDIVLEKSPSGWHVTRPFKARANATRIALLLSLLTANSYAQLSVSDNDHSLSKYGLSPAKVTLSLNDHIFQIGDEETISQHRYVLHNATIHLIDDQVTPLLNANATSFIDNRLIPPNRSIAKLELPVRNTDNTLSTDPVIIENKQGHWHSPSLDMTKDQLTTLIDLWQHAYALQVVPVTKIASQATASTHKVRIFYQGNDHVSEFELRSTKNTLIITNVKQQLTYQFPVALYQQLIPANNRHP